LMYSYQGKREQKKVEDKIGDNNPSLTTIEI